MRHCLFATLAAVILIAFHSPVRAETCYPVGTWNIEHLKKGSKRGFPEYSRGGPTYPQDERDYKEIAEAIQNGLKAKILTVQEINGYWSNQSHKPRSKELNTLLEHLPESWQYVIAQSGKTQRVAILFDTKFVRLNALKEIDVHDQWQVIEYNQFSQKPNKYEPKNIFDRDPLAAHFTLLKNGQPANDLLFVGLHLASGQFRVENHDMAMTLLGKRLADLRGTDPVYPLNETDIIIAGDLNASWYDQDRKQGRENFFDEYNTGHWKVLAGENYPPTRLSGHPLKPGSIIDYIIVSRDSENYGGLYGDEIVEAQANVNTAIAEGYAAENNIPAGKKTWEAFRRVYSDHLPVMTCVKVK